MPSLQPLGDGLAGFGGAPVGICDQRSAKGRRQSYILILRHHADEGQARRVHHIIHGDGHGGEEPPGDPVDDELHIGLAHQLQPLGTVALSIEPEISIGA